MILYCVIAYHSWILFDFILWNNLKCYFFNILVGKDRSYPKSFTKILEQSYEPDEDIQLRLPPGTYFVAVKIGGTDNVIDVDVPVQVSKRFQF